MFPQSFIFLSFFPEPSSILPSILLVPGTVLVLWNLWKTYIMPGGDKFGCISRQNIISWWTAHVMPVNSRPTCALALCSLAEHTSSLRSCWPQSDQVLSQSFHLLIDFPTLLRDFVNFGNCCISMWVQQNFTSRPNRNSWRVCLFYFSPSLPIKIFLSLF